MIMTAAAAAILVSYNCEIDAPRAITLYDTGIVAAASEISMPVMIRRFQVEIREGNPPTAKVIWPGDPMRLAGDFPAVLIAPEAYAFSAYSAGQCLFTERACITQFTIVGRGAEPASVVVSPAAVAKNDDKGGARFALPILAKGQCVRKDLKK